MNIYYNSSNNSQRLACTAHLARQDTRGCRVYLVMLQISRPYRCLSRPQCRHLSSSPLRLRPRHVGGEERSRLSSELQHEAAKPTLEADESRSFYKRIGPPSIRNQVLASIGNSSWHALATVSSPSVAVFRLRFLVVLRRGRQADEPRHILLDEQADGVILQLEARWDSIQCRAQDCDAPGPA